MVTITSKYCNLYISHPQIAVERMLLLIDWLMGVPAGLKLNYRLTIFLGKFFTYHVWLWAGKEFEKRMCVF